MRLSTSKLAPRQELGLGAGVYLAFAIRLQSSPPRNNVLFRFSREAGVSFPSADISKTTSYAIRYTAQV